ncbi:S1 family peptidase [Nonomuraea sp. N2-4H]|uniref:S1 family peptidase n=1 Tax=Nonomuraea sp. N2-4H TaxID=3128898 RepID=UPI003243B28B
MNAYRLAATALTLGLALITGPSVSAFAPGPDADVAPAMERDLGLASGQAAARLAAEERASAAETELRRELGDAFAGTWLADDGTLVAATTDAARVPAIAKAGARADVVTRPLAALDAAKARLDAAARAAGPDVHAWYVDVAANDVVILAADPAEAAAFVEAAGVDASAVRVEPSAARPVPYAGIRGGDGFMVEGKGRCIVGFTARQGTTDGFLTAGHCGEPGDIATTTDGTPIGVFAYSSGSGYDYAWVTLYPGWTPRGAVAAGGTEQLIRGATPAPVGASVCRAAPGAGWHCGIIQQRNVTVNFPEGVITGLVRTNVCSEPGMSGAPFVSGDQAQGVTVGGSGNCASGGTTFFQPVAEALSALGLTLITS